jgi:hypothetical protein
VVGVISSFAGDDEFMGQELLNLIGRTNQQYAVLVKTGLPETAFSGLRAVIYVDAQPPAADLRRRILDFVSAGGLLITGPKWGPPPGKPGKDEHPRYAMRALGKGRVAISKADPDDPYVLANDSAVLISHRYELLRFWNGARSQTRGGAPGVLRGPRSGPHQCAHRGAVAQGQPVDAGA